MNFRLILFKRNGVYLHFWFLRCKIQMQRKKLSIFDFQYEVKRKCANRDMRLHGHDKCKADFCSIKPACYLQWQIANLTSEIRFDWVSVAKFGQKGNPATSKDILFIFIICWYQQITVWRIKNSETVKKRVALNIWYWKKMTESW